MEHKPVKSTNVQSVGYDQQQRHLEVKFRGGTHYRYFNVPQDVYDDLMGSESVGQAFHTLIKGKFEHEKL